jgi:hypothetical protein
VFTTPLNIIKYKKANETEQVAKNAPENQQLLASWLLVSS